LWDYRGKLILLFFVPVKQLLQVQMQVLGVFPPLHFLD
jgi:hypothetical protein